MIIERNQLERVTTLRASHNPRKTALAAAATRIDTLETQPARMLTGRVPFVPHVSFAGVDTRDVAEFHVKALTDPRAWEQRIIAAILGRPLRVTRAAVAAAGKSLIAESLA